MINFLAGSETILVVEDNDLARDLACDILRKRGYMIISAKDATGLPGRPGCLR
jgi:CheY-like chemotaxis protein